MTSDEIKAQVSDYDPDTTGGASAIWLKEIAYQLAVLNERELRVTETLALRMNAIEMHLKRLGSPVGADSDKTAHGGIDGFEPPPVGIFNSHRFVKVRGNRFCGHCGAGEHHATHERTTRTDPQTASIQDKENLRCSIEDAMRRSDRIQPRVPDDSSEI
jgi:hypothetical protein